jgi:hypothetical protein
MACVNPACVNPKSIDAKIAKSFAIDFKALPSPKRGTSAFNLTSAGACSLLLSPIAESNPQQETSSVMPTSSSPHGKPVVALLLTWASLTPIHLAKTIALSPPQPPF